MARVERNKERPPVVDFTQPLYIGFYTRPMYKAGKGASPTHNTIQHKRTPQSRHNGPRVSVSAGGAVKPLSSGFLLVAYFLVVI
jgi:hypothetical protein